jgi:hypothetical protein
MPARRVDRSLALIVFAVLSVGAALLIARTITPRPHPTLNLNGPGGDGWLQHEQSLREARTRLDALPSIPFEFQSAEEVSRALRDAHSVARINWTASVLAEREALHTLTSEFLYYRFGQRSPEVYRRWRTARGDRPIDPAVLRSSGAVENWMLYTKQVTAVTDAKLPATIDPDLIFDQSWDAAIDHVAPSGFRPERLITQQSTFAAITIPITQRDPSPLPIAALHQMWPVVLASFPEASNPAAMCAFFLPPRDERELLAAEGRAVVGIVAFIVQSADGARRLWFLRFVRRASAPGANPASWHLQSWSIANPAAASGDQGVTPYVGF